jgi:hypothetical protein
MSLRATMPRNGKGRLVRPFLLVGLVAASLGCAATGRELPMTAESTPTPAEPGAGRAGGRLRPPATLACDRNHLTSFTGEVSGYRREADQTWLEISTDEDTVEAITVAHAGQADASAHYLLQGNAFGAGDWARIEAAPGKLIADMRATAWVCDDGVTPPVIDWQPPGD